MIVAICILGAEALLVFGTVYLIYKLSTVKIQKENELLKNNLAEYYAFENRFIKIQRYLQKEYNLTFEKIESLIKEENYKKNNVININNFRKFKK